MRYARNPGWLATRAAIARRGRNIAIRDLSRTTVLRLLGSGCLELVARG
jgi:hypothetical protein